MPNSPAARITPNLARRHLGTGESPWHLHPATGPTSPPGTGGSSVAPARVAAHEAGLTPRGCPSVVGHAALGLYQEGEARTPHMRLHCMARGAGGAGHPQHPDTPRISDPPLEPGHPLLPPWPVTSIEAWTPPGPVTPMVGGGGLAAPGPVPPPGPAHPLPPPWPVTSTEAWPPPAP